MCIRDRADQRAQLYQPVRPLLHLRHTQIITHRHMINTRRFPSAQTRRQGQNKRDCSTSGWLKLPTRAGDLGRSPFNGIAEYVGPAPAAAVVGVVVVPAVNAVVVGWFGPTGGGVAHRQEGTGPHWLASITTVVAHSGVRSRVGLRPCRPASSARTLASGGERFLDCRPDTATVGDLIPVGLGPLTNCLSLFHVRTGCGYRCRLRSSP